MTSPTPMKGERVALPTLDAQAARSLSSRPYVLPEGEALADWIAQARYAAYVYAYPHKTAYRPFEKPQPLRKLWAEEDTSALFLYLHIPFCSVRCGFCNLFTRRGGKDQVDAFLRTLERQADTWQREVGGDFASLAVGGGTPTFLDEGQLQRLFELIARLGVSAASVPSSVETSPETADEGRIALLAAQGVERVSIGVQSFDKRTLGLLGRPHQADQGRRALDTIRRHAIERLNLDLIYGAEGQTPQDLERDIREALRWMPEEIFLYPLYVRPQTGLGRRDRAWDDARLTLYRAGRDLLRDAGYVQQSMRSFARRPSARDTNYRCQEDGMVGLGCGARSYTRSVHYADEWAVGARSVEEIIDAYLHRADFHHATYGIVLSEEEQRRRYLIQGLLQAGGIDGHDFETRFGLSPEAAFPQLHQLEALGLVHGRWRLNDEGMAASDVIGPWLYSADTRVRSAEYEVR